MSKVTMQDIADELGISRVTVWKVFNNHSGVSEAVRESVLQKAKELGYSKFMQGADAAAYVAECAERLDMGHGAGQDIPGLQSVQIVGLAHPLRLRAGKPVHGLAVLAGVQPFHHKAGGAAHPGQHGDIPHSAGFGTVGALGKGHHGFDPADLEPQLTLGVKGQRRGLQNFAVRHGGAQLGGAQAGGGTVVAFGTVCLHHLSFLFLCCFGFC